jgi:hypothetical protein
MAYDLASSSPGNALTRKWQVEDFSIGYAISGINHSVGSVILNVWLSCRPLLTACLRPDGQLTSMRSILVASPRPK